MAANAEQKRRFFTASLRNLYERSPFGRKELSKEDIARKLITRDVQAVQRGELEAAPLIGEIDGEDSVILLQRPEIRLPRHVGYGILDLNGRQGNYHSEPVQLYQDLRVFTHPNVLPHLARVVFEAVEYLGDGQRRFVDVWAKRRTVDHDALFENRENGAMNPTKIYTISLSELDKTIEVRQKMPY